MFDAAIRMFCQDLLHSEHLAEVDGGIGRFRVLVGHLHERQFDAGRGVAPDAEVPIQDFAMLVTVHEIEVERPAPAPMMMASADWMASYSL